MLSVAVLIGRGLDYSHLALIAATIDCLAQLIVLVLFFDMQLSKDSPPWGMFSRFLASRQCWLRASAGLVPVQVSGGNGGGVHPFPFRTRKLSPPAPKILDEQLSGKIGHCQINNEKPLCAWTPGVQRLLCL